MVLINVQYIVHFPSFQSTSPGWSLSFSFLLIFVPPKTNCFQFSDLLGIFYHYTSAHCLLFLRDNWAENIPFVGSLFNCKDRFWIQTFAWKNQVPPPQIPINMLPIFLCIATLQFMTQVKALPPLPGCIPQAELSNTSREAWQSYHVWHNTRSLLYW